MPNKGLTYKAYLKRATVVVMLTTVGLFLCSGVVSQHDIPMNKVKISIDETQGNRFVNIDDINALFLSYMGGDSISSIKNINLASLELVLESEPQIKEAELYVSMLGDLHIEILQHNPVLRLIDKAGSSTYLSEKGIDFPVSNRFTARVPVATGNYLLQNDKVKKDLLALANVVNADDWLYALTEQITVNDNGLMAIIPIVGDFEIVIGDALNLEKKIERLKAFYLKGLNNGIGWDRYSAINVSFNKQVVCTKK